MTPQRLEIPKNYSSNRKLLGKRRDSFMSSNSPVELKMSNANFSDLDSSYEEDLMNDSSSPYLMNQKKKAKQVNNKLPDIDTRSSLQARNMQKPKDVLIKIKE